MGSTKSAYHEERSFAFIFCWKFCFRLEPLKKSWFDVLTTQMSIFILFVSARVLFEGTIFLFVSFRDEIAAVNLVLSFHWFNTDVCLGFWETFMMKFFSWKCQRLQAGNYFCQTTPSHMLVRHVLVRLTP